MSGEYPEHDKLAALDGDNETVGNFIEWLREHEYVIARYGSPYEVFAFIDTAHIEDDEVRSRIGAIRRRRRDSDDFVPEEIQWLTAYAIEHELVKWTTQFGRPGGTTAWSNQVMLGEADSPEFTWTEQRADEERLFDPVIGTEKLLAEYFGIDQRKLSDEKDAMLDAIRATHA